MSALLRPRPAILAVTLAAVLATACVAPAPADANLLKPVCKVAQLGSGAVSKLCGVVAAPGKLLKAGGKLISGHIGGALNQIFGGGSSGTGSGGSALSTAAGLAAVGVWVLGGARFALRETAKVLSKTTTPQLGTTWFSSAYWRMAAIAALITLPFLFAVAVQAMIRGDLSLLFRAAFGFLPLALISVGIAAPLTMLVLAATDQLSGVVAAAAGHQSTDFLVRAGSVVGVLSVFRGSPFLAFLVGLIAAGGALVLWLELLMREAAVYIVVLMLPLVFAAMVWPARRIWAVRVVELLVALILAKFAIVSVLALGGAALGHGGGITGALAGAVLVLLGAFAPWALLRLLPLAELASGAAGALRPQTRLPIAMSMEEPGMLTGSATGWARALTAGMSQEAERVHEDPRPYPTVGDGDAAEPPRDRAGEPSGDRVEEPAARSAETVADPAERILAAVGGPSESPAGTSAEDGQTPPAETGPDAPAERSPGLGPMWQAPDLSWRPVELGGEWPPAPLWEPGDEVRAGADEPSAPVEPPALDRPPGEDHNPPPDGHGPPQPPSQAPPPHENPHAQPPDEGQA